MTQIWMALVFGLMAALHCILMCGPLAVALPVGNLAPMQRHKARLLFVSGRWVVYGVMGALAGALSRPIAWMGIQNLWLGIALILLLFFVAFWEMDFLIHIRSQLQHISKSIIQHRPWSGFFMLGLANGMLPCGMVYAALSLSVLAGSVWLGALTMLIFGIANSWWHLIFVMNWRLPNFNGTPFAFLASPRVSMAFVAFALVFRLVQSINAAENYHPHAKAPPSDQAVCQPQL